MKSGLWVLLVFVVCAALVGLGMWMKPLPLCVCECPVVQDETSALRQELDRVKRFLLEAQQEARSCMASHSTSMQGSSSERRQVEPEIQKRKVELFSQLGPLVPYQEEPIDVVYVWTNGSDAAFRFVQNAAGGISTQGSWWGEDGDKEEEKEDNGMLLASVRALLHYGSALSIRTIHIVTAESCLRPSWLRSSRPDLVFHNYLDFVPSAHSLDPAAVFASLHRLPGLASHFLLFRPSMFLTRSVARSSFWIREQGRWGPRIFFAGSLSQAEASAVEAELQTLHGVLRVASSRPRLALAPLPVSKAALAHSASSEQSVVVSPLLYAHWMLEQHVLGETGTSFEGTEAVAVDAQQAAVKQLHKSMQEHTFVMIKAHARLPALKELLLHRFPWKIEAELPESKEEL